MSRVLVFMTGYIAYIFHMSLHFLEFFGDVSTRRCTAECSNLDERPQDFTAETVDDCDILVYQSFVLVTLNNRTTSFITTPNLNFLSADLLIRNF